MISLLEAFGTSMSVTMQAAAKPPRCSGASRSEACEPLSAQVRYWQKRTRRLTSRFGSIAVIGVVIDTPASEP